MSLTRSILIGAALSFLIVLFDVADAQIRVYSSEGVSVIGGTSEDFEKAARKQNRREWHLVDTADPGEKEEEYQQGIEPEKPEQPPEQTRQKQKESKKTTKQGIECFIVPDNNVLFRMCKDKSGKTVSMENLGQVKKQTGEQKMH